MRRRIHVYNARETDSIAKGPLVLSKNSESPAPVRTEAKNGKIIIEGRRTLDAEPPHNRKTGSVNQGEILIAVRNPDLPGRFDVRHADGFDSRDASPQSLPESFRCLAADPVADQGPGFNEDMIACNERLAGRQNVLGAAIARI